MWMCLLTFVILVVSVWMSIFELRVHRVIDYLAFPWRNAHPLDILRKPSFRAFKGVPALVALSLFLSIIAFSCSFLVFLGSQLRFPPLVSGLIGISAGVLLLWGVVWNRVRFAHFCVASYIRFWGDSLRRELALCFSDWKNKTVQLAGISAQLEFDSTSPCVAVLATGKQNVDTSCSAVFGPLVYRHARGIAVDVSLDYGLKIDFTCDGGNPQTFLSRYETFSIRHVLLRTDRVFENLFLSLYDDQKVDDVAVEGEKATG